MKAALRQVDEINTLLVAHKKPESIYLKQDYAKAINRKRKELKEYCFYKGYNYKEMSRRILWK